MIKLKSLKDSKPAAPTETLPLNPILASTPISEAPREERETMEEEILPREKINRKFMNAPPFKLILKHMSTKARANILKYGSEYDGVCLQKDMDEFENDKEPELKKWRVIERYMKIHRWVNKKKLYISGGWIPKSFWASFRLRNDNNHLRGLKKFKILFSVAQGFSDHSLDRLCSQVLHQMTELRRLIFYSVSDDNISEQGLSSLALLLKNNLTKLDGIHLNFNSSKKIDDESLNALTFPMLRYLPKLTALTLCFSSCDRMTDKGVQALASLLGSHLAQMQILKVHFGGSEKISETSLEALMHSFKKLPGLRSLTLGLVRCGRISDKGMEAIKTCIAENLTELRALSLEFSSDYDITDIGIERVAYSISNSLVHLKQLMLDFSGNYKLTDKSLEALGLGQLTNLEHLTIRFLRCYEMTDKGLDSLRSQLASLSHVKEMRLGFSGCEKIMNAGFDGIVEEIKKSLRALHQLSLYFDGTGVTYEPKDTARETLSFVSKIYIS